MKLSSLSLFTLLVLSITACSNQEKTSGTKDNGISIKEETMDYAADTVNMNGFVAYDNSSDKKRPVVLIVHEWWGLNDYAKMRAHKLAELGYLAFAIDMYGGGQQAADPESAGKLAMPFYQDPGMAKIRFDAALAKIKMHPQADTSNIAAIGYCFGGAQVLNVARLGEKLAGVVSFHGNLVGVPPVKGRTTASILVCHGEADQFVPGTEVSQFKRQMDSVGVAYTFKSYPGATHAFTNPDATAKGKAYSIPIAYNAAADSASWIDMKAFFNKIFK